MAQKAGQARGATLFTLALGRVGTVVFVMMAAHFAALGQTVTFCHSLLSIHVVITYTDLQYPFLALIPPPPNSFFFIADPSQASELNI